MISQRHDRAHDELLRLAICGDIPRDDPRLAQRLATCSECQRELSDQDELFGFLEDWGRAARRAKRDLAAGRRAPGSDLVARFVRERVAERRAAARPRAWFPLAAAAALAVTAGGAWLASERLAQDPRAPQTLLGAGPLQLEVSYGALGLPTVTWSADLPPGGQYELRWLDPDGRALELAPRRTIAPSWTPDPSETSALPPRYQLEVTVLGAQSEPLRQASLSLSR
jgi:hypothetical protein